MNFLKSTLFLVFVSFITLNSVQAYKVVASIPPIAALIRTIAGDKVSVETLIDGSQSAHTYALKPSDLNKLKNAEMVFWIGAPYETFLEKAIKAHALKNFSLLETQNLILHPVRVSSDSSQKAGCPYCDQAQPVKVDSHIWLDPENGLYIAQEIAQHLSKQDPIHKDFYQDRLQTFKTELTDSKNKWQKQLDPFKNQVFFVFHDGYQYFEKAFNLQGGKALMEMPDENLSMQKLVALKEMIEQQKIQCLFSEAQFPSRLIDKLSHETSAQVAVLDPLGTSSMSYIEILQKLTDNFVNCFSQSSLKL